MSPQEWVALFRWRAYSRVEPLPDAWSVSIPYGWLRTPEPYWLVVATYTVPGPHSINRGFRKMMAASLAPPTRLKNVPRNARYGGMAVHWKAYRETAAR